MATVHGSTRREFLAAGASGVAGAALLSACGQSQRPSGSDPPQAPLVRRRLGRTGLELPIVSIGSAYEPGLVSAALDAGLTYVHTSGSYADQNHERMLSRVFRGRPRESFLVGSSPDFPEYRVRGRRAVGRPRTRARTRRPSPPFCEGSLQRLGLSHLDIYFLASINDPATVLHEPYMKAYEALKRAGKIRFAGIATHRNEPAVIRAAAKSGFWDVVLTAFNFRQSHREEVRAAIHEAAEAGLGIIAMKTQAGVYWDSRRRQRSTCRRRFGGCFVTSTSTRPCPRSRTTTNSRRTSPSRATRRCGRRRNATCASARRPACTGLYCQQCAACVPQCPKGVQVPDLMRGYMYAVGHRRPRHARHVLRLRTPSDIPCTACADCPVRCALGFDVRARARDLARLLNA